LAIISLAIIALATPVQAATVKTLSTDNLIKVSPSIVNLDLSKDSVSTSFTVDVTNNSKSSITISLSSIDFKSLNDSGGVIFVGQTSNQLSDSHSLANWLKTTATPINIDAGQTIKTIVIVDNRSDLGPGGHYAAVLYTLNGGTLSGSIAKVDVNEVASTLVFIRKLDGANFGINLSKVQLSRSLFSMPKNINLTLNNTGNIQAVPRGLMTIKDPYSKEVSRGLINTDSSLVLPDTSRVYRNSMVKTGSAWLPGIYKVHIAYRLDGDAKIQYKDVSFLYVNFVTATGLGVVLILLWNNRNPIHKLQRRIISKLKSKQ
jgi:hypothetical protein